MTKTLLTLTILLISSTIYADDDLSIYNFAPQNDFRIPVSAPPAESGGITQKEFDKVVEDVAEVYTPIFQAKDKKLTLTNKWDDATVNSDTTLIGKEVIINAYGGLARYKGMTRDSYLMVLCHEVGHHLGGYPKYKDNESWASNEGESDYFASMKCMRLMDKHNDIFSDLSAACNDMKFGNCCKAHKTVEDVATCEKSVKSGKILATVLYELGGETTGTPSEYKKDEKVVSKISDGHPAAQCRLDTYISGAICGVSHLTPLGEKNPKVGACSQEAGAKFGYRPLCWYKPKNDIILTNTLDILE